MGYLFDPYYSFKLEQLDWLGCWQHWCPKLVCPSQCETCIRYLSKTSRFLEVWSTWNIISFLSCDSEPVSHSFSLLFPESHCNSPIPFCRHQLEIYGNSRNGEMSSRFAAAYIKHKTYRKYTRVRMSTTSPLLNSAVLSTLSSTLPKAIGVPRPPIHKINDKRAWMADSSLYWTHLLFFVSIATYRTATDRLWAISSLKSTYSTSVADASLGIRFVNKDQHSLNCSAYRL